MKLKLLKCAICDYWYRPDSHDGHCPACGTVQFVASGRQYTIIEKQDRILGIARAIPRDYTVGRRCLL